MKLKLFQFTVDYCPFSENVAKYFLAKLPDGVELVDSLGQADLCIAFDTYAGSGLSNMPLPIFLSRKTVLYTESDNIFPVLPGCYTNLEKSRHKRGRTFSHGYLAYHSETNGNPFCVYTEKCEKKYLFSFCGRNSHRCREALFRCFTNARDILLEDTSDKYKHWNSAKDPKSSPLQQNYINIIRQSHFSLCPRGTGANSIRLFESMRLGIAPVIISDDWVQTPGINWDEFSIRIPENEIENLPDILIKRVQESELMGIKARQAFEMYFSYEIAVTDILKRLQECTEGSYRSLETISRLIGLLEYYMFRGFWKLYFKLSDFRQKLKKSNV